MFDDLPEELQYGIADLADDKGCNIDDLWIDVQMGEVTLPRHLKHQLRIEVRRKVVERL